MKEDRCCRCTHFQRFYTMGLRKFNRTKIGRCCKCDEIVNALDTCENWEIDTRKLSTNYGLKFFVARFNGQAVYNKAVGRGVRKG